MNQLSIELLMNYLQREDFKLMSTHSKLCYPIIKRICKKMHIGIKFPSIKIHGDIIIDGHHRYLASVIAGVKLETIPTGISSASIVVPWSEVKLIMDDWDTVAKIKMLNELDATFNGINVDIITDLFH